MLSSVTYFVLKVTLFKSIFQCDFMSSTYALLYRKMSISIQELAHAFFSSVSLSLLIFSFYFIKHTFGFFKATVNNVQFWIWIKKCNNFFSIKIFDFYCNSFLILITFVLGNTKRYAVWKFHMMTLDF